jgi:hypothetical protein
MILNELQCEHYIDPQPEDGDTSSFGLSLAANEKYLAVGDTKANRIIVYRHDSQKLWVRFRTVSLPTNPLATNFRKSCTTFKLALTENTLIIGTTTSGEIQEPNQQFYLDTSIVWPIYWIGAVYQIPLTSGNSLERLDSPKNGELAGFYIAAHNNNIAFGIATYDIFGKSSDYITVISNGQRHTFTHSGDFSLYNPFALYENSLVVGSTICQQGRISIFNLAAPNSSPQIVEVPTQIARIALTNEFIIIAEQLNARGFHLNSKTTVLNAADFSITVLDTIGNISAYGSRLVCSHPTTPDKEVGGKLKLFDISRAPPELIYTSNIDIIHSILTRDLLFILIHNGFNFRICVLSFI